MQRLHLSKLKSSSYGNTILLCVSAFVVIFISFYALFYQGLSFDGAFHSQSALNFFESGKYTLDYNGDIWLTQIKVPFQLVNGFFLTLFGKNFVAANMANVLFYVLFGWLSLKLSKQFKSEYILLGLILISFSDTGLLRWGFQGFGEFPSLVLGLLGLLVLTKWHVSSLSIFFAGLLIGAAVATKWVFVLILLPFGVILLLHLLNNNYKFLISSLFGFLLSLVIFWAVEYANHPVSVMHLLEGIISHTVPVNSHYYSNYSERLLRFWGTYTYHSGPLLIAIIKIVAYLQILLLFVSLSLKTIERTKLREVISSNQLFLLVISLFAIEYFFWWLFVSSKPYPRRVFNADVLLIIALALGAKEQFQNKSFQRAFHLLAAVIMYIFLAFSIYTFFSHNYKKLVSIESKGAIALESSMRSGLNGLPKSFNAYGYGWWQAPRWSFLSGVKHKDLLSTSIDDKYELINDHGMNYLFIEPENSLHAALYKEVHEQYKLSTVFKYGRYSIERIDGIGDLAPTGPIESFVDYSKSGFSFFTEGIYHPDKKVGVCWYSPNAKILLDSKDKTEFILSFYVPNIDNYSGIPIINIYFNNKFVYKEQVTFSGAHVIKIGVSHDSDLGKVVVGLKVSNPLRVRDGDRKLGIAVTQIGFR